MTGRLSYKEEPLIYDSDDDEDEDDSGFIGKKINS